MDDPGQPQPTEGGAVKLSTHKEGRATLAGNTRVVRPLRDRIRRTAAAARVQVPIVEKDYALSYVLAGIAAHPVLSDTLVFKGGTALKKAYFGEYRFSEDLDFSTQDAPRADEMEEAFRSVVASVQERLRQHGPFEVKTERVVPREPHPGGQDAFYIWVRFPWFRTASAMCRVKVEITHDEPVLLEPELRPISHGYDEELAVQVRCYRLEEVVAEKMRTLRQTHEKLLARGWNRPRARDYYDLWRVLSAFGERLERERLPELVARKCIHRGVSFASLDDFFTEPLVAEARKHWKTNIETFVANAPGCDEVLEERRALLPGFFADLTWPDLARRPGLASSSPSDGQNP